MDVSELFPGNTHVDEAPSMAIHIFLAAFAFFLYDCCFASFISSAGPGLLFRFRVFFVKRHQIVYSIIWFILDKANCTGSYEISINHTGFA